MLFEGSFINPVQGKMALYFWGCPLLFSSNKRVRPYSGMDMRINILEVSAPVIERVAIDVVNVFTFFWLCDDSVHTAVDCFAVFFVSSDGIDEGF